MEIERLKLRVCQTTLSAQGVGAGGSPLLSSTNQPQLQSLRDRFRAFGAINVAVYAACFRRLAIFAMVARLQPVNDWIVLQDCCAVSI